MKKYLIRVLGALCIVAALAVMILPTCIKIDGMKSKNKRLLRGNTEAFLSAAEDALVDGVKQDAIEEDLEDNDLPATKSKLKSWLKEIENVAEDALDEEISLKEILVLLCKAPGITKDMQNLMNTDYAMSRTLDALAYEAYKGNLDPGVKAEPEQMYEWVQSSEFRDSLEDTVEMLDPVPIVCYIVLGVFGLFGALAVWAVVGHICNKGRWGKYVLLALVVLVVVGTCVALPLLSGVIEETAGDVSLLKGVQLRMTAAPFCVIALMIVPIVLDIIFERKYKTIKAEEVKNG